MSRGLKISAIIISLSLFCLRFITNIVLAIWHNIVFGMSWSDYEIYSLVFLAVIVAFSFLLEKNKTYSFAIFILSISYFCCDLLYFIPIIAWQSFFTYIELVSYFLKIGFSLAMFVFSIVLFVKTHPFRRDDGNNEEIVPKKRKKYDYFDEIKRLKELFDCGALTQEEFDVEKKKVLENK